eukprot:scaffold2195_cov333-Pavlova_lutheri.AAC.7
MRLDARWRALGLRFGDHRAFCLGSSGSRGSSGKSHLRAFEFHNFAGLYPIGEVSKRKQVHRPTRLPHVRKAWDRSLVGIIPEGLGASFSRSGEKKLPAGGPASPST